MAHCRICLEEDGTFVHPCRCKGSTGNVHAKCLTKWIEESGHTECEICHTEYNTHNVCACNVGRVMQYMFELEYHTLLCKISITILCSTFAYGLLFGWDFLILAPYGSTAFYIVFLIALCKRFDIDLKIAIDYAFVWKLCFAVPYAILNLVFQYHLMDQCDYLCSTISDKFCDVGCNFYAAYWEKIHGLTHSLYIEGIATFVVFILRTLYICSGYNRNRVFSNFSSTGATGSGSDSGSAETIV